MSHILERLKLDHVRLRNVLNELNAAAEEAATGKTSAEDRLFCMMDYLVEYPHEIHHPIEDLVFARALEKTSDEAQAKVLYENANQHRALENETERLFAATDMEIPNFDEIKQMILYYSDHQLQHMAHEEADVFPLVKSLLEKEDWDALEEQYAALHDPLFDMAESRFSALYNCLGVDPDDPGLRLGVSSVVRFLNAT